MPGSIHHIEWCVSDLQSQVRSLVTQYGFKPIGQRIRKLGSDWIVRQVLVKSGDTVFMLTQKSRASLKDQHNVIELSKDEFPLQTCCGNTEHSRDTVFNVSLNIGSQFDDILEKFVEMEGLKNVIDPVQSIKDCRYSVIKSCCGNIIHTLLDKKSNFPGFENVSENYGQIWNDNCTTHMDHVTYVCEEGQSQRILSWYSDLFKMQRFFVNPDEDEKGVEISGDVNMRLTVGEWLSSWMCREEGVQLENCNNEKLNFKLVLAEPLDNEKDSHVKNFLNHHGGPGLQHIGLTTPNAAKTVQIMTDSGAQFRRPPPTYYKLESKIREIKESGEDLEKCANLGLLFDSEADFCQNGKETVKKDHFLVQVFTKPVFGPEQDTFFLEVLERRGAKGFGAGNITALAQSIILYQQQLKMSSAAA